MYVKTVYILVRISPCSVDCKHEWSLASTSSECFLDGALRSGTIFR
jgi:hypothetical protein